MSATATTMPISASSKRAEVIYSSHPRPHLFLPSPPSFVPPILPRIQALHDIALDDPPGTHIHHRDPARERRAGIQVPDIATLHGDVDVIIGGRSMAYKDLPVK